MTIEERIRAKFHTKRGDNLPFTCWIETSRQQLAELFSELGYKLGAEIGVRQGLNSEALLKTIPGLKLICVDPWTPYARVNQGRQDSFYRHALGRLSGLNAEIKRMTSMEAAKEVADGSLDFVYIDGLHTFDDVIMDLIEWSKKVRVGGIVSGHDFYFFYQGGVVQAVSSFTAAHNITQWYITREIYPSWFWIKT